MVSILSLFGAGGFKDEDIAEFLGFEALVVVLYANDLDI